jgi:MSHA biogenesis protein MshQ
LQNALGSEKIDLPIPLEVQYWNGSGFATNAADSCTSLTAANLSLGAYTGGINATNMGVTHINLGGAFSSGVGSLILTKPSPVSTSPGTTTLTVDLSAEAKSYLKGNWGVPTYTANPSSRAAFGLYGSQPKNFIYFRENY